MKKFFFLKPQRREAKKVACDSLLCGMCDTLRAAGGGTWDPELGVLCRRRARNQVLEAFLQKVRQANVAYELECLLKMTLCLQKCWFHGTKTMISAFWDQNGPPGGPKWLPGGFRWPFGRQVARWRAKGGVRNQNNGSRRCLALLCFALRCFALLCFVSLCVALLRVASLCAALRCSALFSACLFFIFL